MAALLSTALAAPAPRAARQRRATIFYTGAAYGTLEPCGCTSDPLGDVARMTGLVRRAQKETGAVLLVDAGNLSYAANGVPAKRQVAADLKAGFLAEELAKLPFGGSALGDADLARGPERVVPKRLAANLPGVPYVEPSRLTEVGGIKIGVLGLADPDAASARGLAARDPVPAARAEAERLRKQGAEVVIALVPLDRPRARQIARAADVDFVVLGKETGDGLARAEAVGHAYIVAPAVELQRVGRLDIVLRDTPAARIADAGGPEAARLRRAELDRLLTDRDAQLAAWEKDRAADATFVAAKRKERDDLRAERAQIEGGPWQPPASGSYFTNELIPLRRALPQDPALAKAMRALNRAIGRANLRVAEPPQPAERGRAAFVGIEACAPCHKPELALWKKTVHAGAWKTLIDVDKTGHDDCVSCHVTGYGEVGGSSLGYVRGLTAIQCETCHGPGSLHVAAQGLEDPPAVKRGTPESTCQRCHNEKHSDTFQYTAYLRDILGPGHGASARKKLGDGPTGHELRKAAIARAKAAGELQKRALD